MSSRTSPFPSNNDKANCSTAAYEPTPAAYEPIDEIIRQLIACLGARKPFLDACVSEEIILDCNVDEMRFLVIRMPAVTPAHCPLSPREQEIARMVANGHPTKVIAGVLNISCWTVSAHLRRIFAKLGVASRPAMVARLLEEGRNWDVHLQPNTTLSETKAFVKQPSQHHRSSVAQAHKREPC
jgi:DNA-binding CsgD family transcriptional regulator